MIIGIVLMFVLWAPPILAHDEFVLDARRATPGPLLELIKLAQTTTSAVPKYKLQVATGLPPGVSFRVLTKDFSHGFHTVASGFQLDDSGELVSRESINTGGIQRLQDMIFEPGPYPRGAAWEAALVSSDRAIRLFAKIIPHPITASEGSCNIALELISQRGERFIVNGSGFAPDNEVITESRYSGRVIQMQKRVSPEGLLGPDIISHRAGGLDRTAGYLVKGRFCHVVVDYRWGEPALTRR